MTNQVAGNSDWPPNTHWTNRPVTYAFTNLVTWGLGLPLGITACLGFLWAVWRTWQGEWRCHLLPLIWVAAYFIWQNAQFWRYMRYFMPIYPFLFLFAAWFLMEILKWTRESRANLLLHGTKIKEQLSDWRRVWQGGLGLLAVAIVFTGTYFYAYSFIQIYTHPVTRITASRWMIHNIPGPVNLLVESGQKSENYPVTIHNKQAILPGITQASTVNVDQTGISSSITTIGVKKLGASILLRLTEDEEGEKTITEGRLTVADDDESDRFTMVFGDVNLEKDQTYYLHYQIFNNNQINLNDIQLGNENEEEPKRTLNLSFSDLEPGEMKGVLPLRMDNNLRANQFVIGHFSQQFKPGETSIKMGLFKEGDEEHALAESQQTLVFQEPGEVLTPTFKFDAIPLTAGKTYKIKFDITGGGGVAFKTTPYTMETSWDDALPLGVDGYDALGNLYNPLNLELYEPDTHEKRDSMIQILDESEYIVLSSNRAYDAMPRLPLRYPLTTRYYQELFDCNCTGDDLENKAYGLTAPFKSPLGFDLVATFENPPAIGPIKFPDQTADESFTVYDHPKVLIFKKSADFSIEHVKAVLNSVDLTQIIFQTPLSFTKAPTAFQFSDFQLLVQRAGGDWAAMFDYLSLINSNQTLATIAWYLLIFLIGLICLPMIFWLFKGLPDRGYALGRMFGLVTVSWLAWILGSLSWMTFTSTTILLCLALVLLGNLIVVFRQRQMLADFIRSQWKYILTAEIIHLVLFALFLNIRLGNPDLWNPWLGGEKPMDFAYFNAVLKAVYFPPENPWFSGHYLNYYYYGYVIAAIPTKLLGIVPSMAFNLILPAWFAMTGCGLFCLGYNLTAGLRQKDANKPLHDGIQEQTLQSGWRKGLPYYAGIMAVVAVLILGNLFEMRNFWQYLPEVVQFNQENPSVSERASAALAGGVQVLTGQSQLPGANSRWYFEASRPILHNGPDTPIAEFPYFTFLYGDLHAHLLTMPFYALALGWMLALFLRPLKDRGWLERLVFLLAGGLLTGLFRASHTWDFPTYLGLALLVFAVTAWHETNGMDRKETIQRTILYALIFTVSALVFYWPFSEWFKTEYVSIEWWNGARTPFTDYLTVFGLSLFVILSLMIQSLIPEFKAFYRYWVSTSGDGLVSRTHFKFYGGLFLVLGVIILLWSFNFQVLAFGLPLLSIIFYLAFFKPGQSSIRKMAWILFGIGLALTLMVELIVLKGDSGRQNMVFRYYNEAWYFFGIGLSLALVDMLPGMAGWPRQVRYVWLPALVILFACALSYPLTATQAKINDRWPDIQNPSHALDGALFMKGESGDTSGQAPAFYNDEGRQLNLAEDYQAIRYMQEKITGSPVIVEGHTSEYRWGSRFSIYTGLPTVIGWSWHVRQHNSLLDGAIIEKRIEEVNRFYNTTDMADTETFLTHYRVKYIVIGDLERAYYDPQGMQKFQKMIDRGSLRLIFGDMTENTTTVLEVVQ